jgi:threonine-phosphate decarboxylase
MPAASDNASSASRPRESGSGEIPGRENADFSESLKMAPPAAPLPEPPSHGGQLFKIAAMTGKSPASLLDFSVNLNPLGPHPKLLSFLKKTADLAFYYPDPWNAAVAKDLSSHYNVPEDRVLPGSGSTPLIYSLIRTLSPQRPVIIGPAFSEYGQALAAIGAKPLYANARKEDGFLVTPGLFEEALSHKPDLVIAAHPANPTGRLVPWEILLALAESASEKGGPSVLLDEAFIDFCENGRNLLEMAASRPKIYVLRSLTKFFCVPGLRLGFAVGDSRVLAAAKALLGPWTISTQAQSAVRFLLLNRDYYIDAAEMTACLRKRLQKALSPFRQYPSDANFILMSLPEEDARRWSGFEAFLLDEGVILRNASDMPGLAPGFFRFAVKSGKDISKLSRAVKAFLAARPAGRRGLAR